MPSMGKQWVAGETVSGSEKREAHQERKVVWHRAMLSGQRRKLARAHLETVMEECQASGRATVDYLVLHVQQMCGYDTRYRSLAKHGNRLALLLGVAHLLRSQSCGV